MTTKNEIMAMVHEVGGTMDVGMVLVFHSHKQVHDLIALAIAHDRQRLAAGVEMPERVDEVLVITGPNTHKGMRAGQHYFRLDQLRDYGDRRAAAAMEEANRKANASWTLMCQKMVLAEREACAVVCDTLSGGLGGWAGDCANDIRARSLDD